MNALEHSLLNDFQRNLPVCQEPYVHMANALETSEAEVITTLERLLAQGKVSRVGAVFRPNSVHASTLAAMLVPDERLDEVAAMVSACPGVSHNYERDYPWNLWFVAAGKNEAVLTRLLDRLQTQSGCPMLRLPLVESYHIDLGFNLGIEAVDGADDDTKTPSRQTAVSRRCSGPLAMNETEIALADALAGGLPLEPRPWSVLAKRLKMTEDDAMAIASRWLTDGVISRFGVIVRHHELGYRSNAMVAFDVPDNLAAEAGLSIASVPAVTLSARRARSLPEWPYNVYCMIHGRDHRRVLAQIEEMRERCQLRRHPFAVLFSRQRFKQQAARFAEGAAYG